MITSLHRGNAVAMCRHLSGGVGSFIDDNRVLCSVHSIASPVITVTAAVGGGS